MRARFVLLGAMLAAITAGCNLTRSKAAAMERVAKDWALTIRASQIVPVYPLTEDLMPGDLFLVSTSIETQAAEYEKKGFLPLDQLLARIPPEGYGEFYKYWPGAGAIPKDWREGGGEGAPHGWQAAPRAAFPSYTFRIERGGGINLAIPAQGVPVALSLLGAASASGSVTIAEAYTYGVDDQSLRVQLMEWANENRAYLAGLGSTAQATRYLRIVTRVFLTGRVNVSLVSDSAFAAGATAGEAKPAEILGPGDGDAAGRYVAAVQAMDGVVAAAVPGGSIKIAAASSRSISLNETFPRPLVIGYLGFDVPIGPDGRLGPPVSTEALLSRTATALPYAPASSRAQAIEEWLEGTRGQEPDTRRERLKKWLTANGIQMSPTLWLSTSAERGREEQYARFCTEVGISSE
ncbi:MAG: hypothetical protein ACT4PV_02260 [Planctomycetaceae bacterium]